MRLAVSLKRIQTEKKTIEQEYHMEELKTGGQTYTCTEYREEMILLGLQRQLAAADLSPERRESLLKEIARVEVQMGLD